MRFRSLSLAVLSVLPVLSLGAPTSEARNSRDVSGRNVDSNKSSNDYSVLILGGGVAGVIAARQLAAAGIKDFLIVEARHELGGRLQSTTFGGKGGQKEYIVERGANWVQGTFEGDGPVNPIYKLARKHKISTVNNDWEDITTYDHTGEVDYTDLFTKSEDAYAKLTVGAGNRVETSLADLTARTGYSLGGWKPKTPQAMACEYYQFDWEYANTPIQTSWIASSYGNNFTYTTAVGGFGGDNLMCNDQRGFKHMIQAEAKEFLKPSQVLYDSVVTNIAYSSSGVTVTLKNGRKIKAKKALVTFSLGVLQHDDVTWTPQLPDWKQEAIHSMTMATFTKIFMQFPSNFWFPTEMGLYADPHQRGKHPVWQSLDHAKFFPDSHILFVTITGDYSEYFETLYPEAAQKEVMEVVRAMFPNVTVPDPLDFAYPKWHSDPLFREATVTGPVSASFYTQHLNNLRAVVSNTVYFAGEALSLKYFGFLHGAYFEGLSAGNAIAKCLNDKGCLYVNNIEETKSCYQYNPLSSPSSSEVLMDHRH